MQADQTDKNEAKEQIAVIDKTVRNFLKGQSSQPSSPSASGSPGTANPAPADTSASGAPPKS